MSTTMNSNDDDDLTVTTTTTPGGPNTAKEIITIEPVIFDVGLSPQQIAYHLVKEFPNITRMNFVGKMYEFAQNNNNLSILLKALIIDDNEEEEEDDESTTAAAAATTTKVKKLSCWSKINTIDFSGLVLDRYLENDKKELIECLQIVRDNLLPHNTLKEIRIPGFSKAKTGTLCQTGQPIIFGKPIPNNGPPSSLIIDIFKNHENTLTYLDLGFRDDDDVLMEALVDSLKHRNNTTLLYFNSYDFYNLHQTLPQNLEIIQYYLALNNLGRKEWKNQLGADRNLCIDSLSKIPKPEEFDTYDDDDRTTTTTITTTTNQKKKKKKKNPTYLTHCMKTLMIEAKGNEEQKGEKKKNLYTSFVFEFLQCNLELFETPYQE